MKNQANVEQNDMKEESKLKSKNEENLSGSPRKGQPSPKRTNLRLSGPTLPFEPCQDHSRARLGNPRPRLGVGVHFGEACLSLGEGPLH